MKRAGAEGLSVIKNLHMEWEVFYWQGQKDSPFLRKSGVGSDSTLCCLHYRPVRILYSLPAFKRKTSTQGGGPSLGRGRRIRIIKSGFSPVFGNYRKLLYFNVQTAFQWWKIITCDGLMWVFVWVQKNRPAAYLGGCLLQGMKKGSLILNPMAKDKYP